MIYFGHDLNCINYKEDDREYVLRCYSNGDPLEFYKCKICGIVVYNTRVPYGFKIRDNTLNDINGNELRSTGCDEFILKSIL